MSISTFNFQFYNYKLNPASPGFGCAMALGSGFGSGSTSRTSTSNSFVSELEMDIDEDMSVPSVTSTPKPRFTSQLAVELTKNQDEQNGPPALRPKLHTAQKRWSMELREKVLEMSKRNNASDVEEAKPQAAMGQQQQEEQQQHLQQEAAAAAVAPTVSDKINFFNKLTNTFESAGNTNSHRNRFISLLRSSRPQVAATTTGSNSSLSSVSSQTSQMVPPPKPKRLAASAPTPSPFATPSGVGKGGSHRKCTLRRKPSMDKSRATISRQNSSATVRPQHHAIMEDLSLVVPVRLRIAEYEQRISMSA